MFTEYFEEIKQAAIKNYPYEFCGVITKSKGFYSVKNVSDSPDNSFRIDKKALAKAYKEELLAIVHSHPNGPNCPSKVDMIAQEDTGVVWVIVTTDGETASMPFLFGKQAPIPPLVGRAFRHGVTDCYSLIKDYYFLEKNIVLPIGQRDWEWWYKEGEDLYTKNFKNAGFRVIQQHEVIKGDVFLAQLRSKTPNHGGVYIGDGLILHHLSSSNAMDITRLSAREPLNRWQNFITHWLRYEENSITR